MAENKLHKDWSAIWREDHTVFIIDQTRLPFHFEIVELHTYIATANAIRDMLLRGAGTIGVAAAYAMAQAFAEHSCRKDIDEAKAYIEAARPTAQNLFYATNRVYDAAIDSNDPVSVAFQTADDILHEDEAHSRMMGEFGAELIEDGFGILTHCNAGKLAIQGCGSALAPIYVAYEQGKDIFIYADETRPRLQGAQLTAWELNQAGIPHAIIADNAAGYYMQKKKINIVFVGADRIACNGDVANKIGTYEKAVLAKENNIPFYVVAPCSTIDFACKFGEYIPIEERSHNEVKSIGRSMVANPESDALNPAFDVTPARYITGIITEKGIVLPENVHTLA
ncbi:MAG TPA: S-methyl-5-thioribose-1-phosphate isomerase [Candidatus Cloacimonetes bacterium]|nr:S-methyl-5-thioribose-1-phosphate isomerase [Candidatus Cloacimonadota bacterium]HEX37714.1 S-methyl-5-thioribose-1-phosphate isomerase [Candidatus Cloacimonadota bacterium]